MMGFLVSKTRGVILKKPVHDSNHGFVCLNKIEFLPIYRYFQVAGDSVLGTGGFVIERLDRHVCSSGLVDVDGTAKPAWNEFKNQIEMISTG